MYEGHIKHGEPHGTGTITQPNGQKFGGVWELGELNGKHVPFPRYNVNHILKIPSVINLDYSNITRFLGL